MTLREAARRTTRSVTTLRRYIRSGRLRADKRPGRFGPEYFVTEQSLTNAGLNPGPEVSSRAMSLRRRTELDRVAEETTAAALLRDSVPVGLYQELQMKHEQLLVQYGMIRASGAKFFELKSELEDKQQRLQHAEAEAARLRRQLIQETTRLKRLLRKSELEQHGKGLEIAALNEKVRALEMLTRNARTSDTIERQFRELMGQSERVERMSSDLRKDAGSAGHWPPTSAEEPDH